MEFGDKGKWGDRISSCIHILTEYIKETVILNEDSRG